jgi:hypothetical protein
VSRAALVLLVLVAAGCGGASQEKGNATLWVTRDRGARVLMVKTIPAGLTAMQALDRVADIETTYGGRYVQSIDGIEGNLSARRDWFYFVNGIEADRGASEYRLAPGDIEWWDYRSWAKRMRQPVVVGAFPEPFLHGRTVVIWPQAPSYRRVAQGITRLTRGGSVSSSRVNEIFIVPGRGFRAELDGPGVVGRLGIATARKLVRDPSAVRFRYEVP